MLATGLLVIAAGLAQIVFRKQAAEASIHGLESIKRSPLGPRHYTVAVWSCVVTGLLFVGFGFYFIFRA